MKSIYIILSFCLLLTSCRDSEKNSSSTSQPPEVSTALKEKPTPKPTKEKLQEISPKEIKPQAQPVVETTNTNHRYPWIDNYNEADALINQIGVPAGYQRIKVDEGSFGEWLRYLPLAAKGTKVLLYNGQEKPYQRGANRVINIDIGNRDLQQCADAVMRLKAEYHYSQKEYNKIHFNYTSGHKVAFDDWRKGKKPRVKGGKVSFSSPTGSSDNSYSNFKKYMRSVFMYAGTASLEKEMKTKALADLQPGDVFIKGGYPGHAILVLDVAQNTQGHKLFLVAQSYMPAQSIHILNNFNNTDLSPWYPIDFGATLATPEWDFAKEALHKFD